MKKNRIVIFGTRSFNDYSLFKERLFCLLVGRNDIQLVFSNEPGTDRMAKRYALENGIEFKVFTLQKSVYGAFADNMRIQAMERYGTECIVFWDKKGDRTKKMIQVFKEKEMSIVYYNQIRK